MSPWGIAVCWQAVNTYGKDSQQIICMEKLAELTRELSRHIRGDGKVILISEGMAEVEIMLEQLRLIFDNHSEICDIKLCRLLVLADRLELSAE